MFYVCMLGVQTAADVAPAREQCSSELKALLYITTRRSLLDATLRVVVGGAGGRGRGRRGGGGGEGVASTSSLQHDAHSEIFFTTQFH